LRDTNKPVYPPPPCNKTENSGGLKANPERDDPSTIRFHKTPRADRPWCTVPTMQQPERPIRRSQREVKVTVTLTGAGVTYAATYTPTGAGPRLTDLRLRAGEGVVITSDVLRRAPLSDLYAAAVEASPQPDTTAPEVALPLPHRFRTDEDYRRLLQRYDALIRQGDRKPLHTLAAAMGTTHNTTAARIKTARKRLNIEEK
jgi:hypothetical protein